MASLSSPSPPPLSDFVDYQPPSTRDKAFPVAPAELRCGRMDGRLWQCKQYRIEGQRYCQMHYFQIVLKIKSTKVERPTPTPTPAPVSTVRDSLQRTRGSKPSSLKGGCFSAGNGKMGNSGDVVPVKNPRSKMGMVGNRNGDYSNEGLGKKKNDGIGDGESNVGRRGETKRVRNEGFGKEVKTGSDGESEEDSDDVGSFIRRAKLSEKLLNGKKKKFVKAELKDENNKSGEQQVGRRGGLKSASINYKDESSEETEEEELEMGREQTRARISGGMMWGGSKGKVLRKNRSLGERGTHGSNNGAVSVSVNQGKRKRSDWGASTGPTGTNDSVYKRDIVYRRGGRLKKDKIDSNGIGNDSDEQGKRIVKIDEGAHGLVNGTKRQKVVSGSDEDGEEISQCRGESEEIDEGKRGRDNEAAGDHTDDIEEVDAKSEALLKREEKMGLLQMLKLEKKDQEGTVVYETRKKRKVPNSNHIGEAKEEEVKTGDKCISAVHSDQLEVPTFEPPKERAVHIYSRRHR